MRVIQELEDRLHMAVEAGKPAIVLDIFDSDSVIIDPRVAVQLLADTYLNLSLSETFLYERKEEAGEVEAAIQHLKNAVGARGRSRRIEDGKQTLEQELIARRVEKGLK